MPMDFPNLESLKSRAKQRGFRQPEANESEEQYRQAFADYMRPIDPVESTEIRSGLGWDAQSPIAMLAGLLSGAK